MTNPQEFPPRRLTAHGAVCSDRLSRLYTWFAANYVNLSDFSTDNCVAREMHKLVNLQRALESLRANSPARYLDDLASDLAAIMRRTPESRVTKGNVNQSRGSQ